MLVSSKYFANQLEKLGENISNLEMAQVKNGVLTLSAEGALTAISVDNQKDSNWFDIQNINFEKVLKCLKTVEGQPINIIFNETGLLITFCF